MHLGLWSCNKTPVTYQSIGLNLIQELFTGRSWIGVDCCVGWFTGPIKVMPQQPPIGHSTMPVKECEIKYVRLQIYYCSPPTQRSHVCMTSQFDARYHLQQSVVKKGSLVCFQESSEYHHQGQFIIEVLRIGFQSCFPRTIDNLYQWVLIFSIVLNKHLSTHLYSASNQVTSSLIANLTVGDVRPLLNVQFHIQTANLVTIIVALQVQRHQSGFVGGPRRLKKLL